MKYFVIEEIESGEIYLTTDPLNEGVIVLHECKTLKEAEIMLCRELQQ